MSVCLVKVELPDKFVLRNLFQLYQYEFSEIEEPAFADVNEHGLYDYTKYLDHYWTEDDRHPFLIRVDGKLAGFTLVQEYSYLNATEKTHCIAEFFVMRRYRLHGVGEQVAGEVF